MVKKIIVGILVLLAVCSGVYFVAAKRIAPGVFNFAECEKAGYPVGESFPRQCWTPDGRQFIEQISGSQQGTITVRGEMTCLTKKGNGPQTMECAIGLKSTDGRQYSLKNLSLIDPEYTFSQSGLSVEVTGVVASDNPKGPDGNAYDVVGTIDVQSITDIQK